MSYINSGEVFCRLLRVRGLEEAEAFWEDVRRGSLPISLVEVTRKRVREAARIKAHYAIAYAEAFAAQTAREEGVPLFTGDPQLKRLGNEGMVALVRLGTF